MAFRFFEPWLDLSEHASLRMAQRGITNEEIEYVCRYGRVFSAGGTVHYFLGKKNIPYQDRNDPWVQRLEGTTVLVDRETGSLVLTVYRNKKAIKYIRRKEKYDRRLSH